MVLRRGAVEVEGRARRSERLQASSLGGISAGAGDVSPTLELRVMAFVRSSVISLALLAAVTSSGCKSRYAVGDEVLVEWEKNNYPAVILEAQGTTKFKVHYKGYDAIWDEVVPRDRIKGPVEGTVVHPEPPAKVRAKAIAAAQTNIYKIGDRVRVEWHGTMYPAVIVGIVGQERYRIHFEGYGDEWDDTVGLPRIQPR